MYRCGLPGGAAPGQVVQSLPGILLLMFVAQLFWVIGIHGNQMIKPIREPLLLGAITVNMSAFEQGKEVPNIITMPFWDVYMSIGGSGLTIGLLIAVMIATRRKEMKDRQAVDRPGLFNINEPVIFRMPESCLTPSSRHPVYHHPLVTGSIGCFATLTGFAGKAVVMVPWTTPPLINAWLSTAGSMGAVVTRCLHRRRSAYLSAFLSSLRRADAATQVNNQRTQPITEL